MRPVDEIRYKGETILCFDCEDEAPVTGERCPRHKKPVTPLKADWPRMASFARGRAPKPLPPPARADHLLQSDLDFLNWHLRLCGAKEL